MRGGRRRRQCLDGDDRKIHSQADLDPGRSVMSDFSALLLDPIYDALGVEAELEAAGTVTLTVLDKTEGVILESPNSPLQMATAKPAACVRMSELAANEILREDLKNAAIT